MLITTVGQYADLMILDWVNADKRQVAVYSLATIYFFAASALAGSVQSIATPAFTALLYHPQDFAALLRRWSIMLSFSAILMAIPLVGLAFAMEHWILGPAYAGLAAIVMVLMARFCLWCTYAVGGAAMVGMGAIKQGMWIAAVTSTLSVAIGYPLCVRYGIWGATWTQVIVAVASAVLVWWFITVEMRKYQARGSVASYLHS